jgi:hypothetical protein
MKLQIMNYTDLINEVYMLPDIDAALARLPRTRTKIEYVVIDLNKRIRFLEDQLRRKEAKAMKWKGRYYALKREIDDAALNGSSHINTTQPDQTPER